MIDDPAATPFDTFETPPLVFGAPANDAAEQRLQAALMPLLQQHREVKRAYLARVNYQGAAGGLILGLETSEADNEELVAAIGRVFAAQFDGSRHLDIIFLSDAQIAGIAKVCSPFHARRWWRW